MEGKNSVMPAVIRTSNNPYTWEIGMGELKDIANVEN
jgi:6-phosphofructokinase 1